MKFTTIDLTPRIGSEIRTDRETMLDGSAAAEFRRLLEQRGVIVFREANLDDRQQVAFARTLGEVTQLGENSIFKVTLDKSVNRSAEYLKGTFFWHIDGTTD